jgi:hypothetical protein
MLVEHQEALLHFLKNKGMYLRLCPSLSFTGQVRACVFLRGVFFRFFLCFKENLIIRSRKGVLFVFIKPALRIDLWPTHTLQGLRHPARAVFFLLPEPEILPLKLLLQQVLLHEVSVPTSRAAASFRMASTPASVLFSMYRIARSDKPLARERAANVIFLDWRRYPDLIADRDEQSDRLRASYSVRLYSGSDLLELVE